MKRLVPWSRTPSVTDPVSAAPAGAPLPPDAPCANCGDDTPGRYCRSCGQARRVVTVSLREMVVDFLDDQLTLNSALPRTVALLLFHPGYLTQEYLRGRIARYIRPLRLYLASSLVFFLTLTLNADVRRLGEQLDREAVGVADSVRAAAAADTVMSVNARGARIGVTRSTGGGGGKIFSAGISDTTRVAPWLRPLAHRAIEQEKRLNGMSRGEAIRRLVVGMESNAPKAVFLLLPVFALILKLLYARRGRLYVEHFVFALHVHAFAFVLFTLMFVTPGAWVTSLLALWFLVYLFLAMKRIYRQSVSKTAVKYLLLGWGYFFALAFGMVATLLITALTV